MGSLSGGDSLTGAFWPPGICEAEWSCGGGKCNGATSPSTVCTVWDAPDGFVGESGAAATALGCLNPAASPNMTTPATQNAAIFPVGLFTKLTASRAFMAGLIWVERAVVPAARWLPSVLPERR